MSTAAFRNERSLIPAHSRSDARPFSFIESISIMRLAYYLAFALYSAMGILDRTTLLGPLEVPRGSFDDCVQVFVLALLVAKFFSQRMTSERWVVSLLIIGVGFVSWRCAHEGWLFWLVLFVVCSEDVSVRVLAGISLIVVGSLTAGTVLCSAVGVIQNVASVRGGITRQAMGFSHPNFLGLYLLLSCVSFSTLRFGKGILPDVALAVVTTAINLLVADSRSSAVLAALLVLMLLAFRLARGPRSQRVLSWICVAVVLAAIAASYYLMVAYDPGNPTHAALNSALSGRLRLANAYYRMQPLTPFGSDFSQFDPIYWEGDKPYAFVVDNAFCHLILRYGIVPTALFMVGLFGLLGKLLREQRCDVLLFGITLMMVYGMSETLGIRVECDFFLVAMGSELLFDGSAAANHRVPVSYRRTFDPESAFHE